MELGGPMQLYNVIIRIESKKRGGKVSFDFLKSPPPLKSNQWELKSSLRQSIGYEAFFEPRREVVFYACVLHLGVPWWIGVSCD